MTLMEHAERELKALDFYTSDDEVIKQLKEDIIDLITVFTFQNHNKESAFIVSSMFNDLVNMKRLCSLQGTEEEWEDISSTNDGKPLFQNKRHSTVFKNDKIAYQLDGIVFVNPDGTTYTTENSVVVIPKFPYEPNRQIIKVNQQEEK